MGMATILVMWPGPFEQTHFPIQRRLHMKFGFNPPSGFRVEDVWNVDTYIHTTEAYLYSKLTNEPSAQVR